MLSKLGVHEKIYSFIRITILSSNDSNGFTSFKINVLLQRFLIPPSLHLSLFLSRDSDHQLVSSISELCSNYTLYVYRQTDIFHIAMRNIKHGRARGCCGSEQYLLANTSYCYKLNDYFKKMQQCSHVYCCIKALIRIKKTYIKC